MVQSILVPGTMKGLFWFDFGLLMVQSYWFILCQQRTERLAHGEEDTCATRAGLVLDIAG